MIKNQVYQSSKFPVKYIPFSLQTLADDQKKKKILNAIKESKIIMGKRTLTKHRAQWFLFPGMQKEKAQTCKGHSEADCRGGH